MGKNSRSKRASHNTPHPKPQPKGPPRALIGMLIGGFGVIILMMVFSRPADPKQLEPAADDAPAQAAKVQSAKGDEKAAAKEAKPQKARSTPKGGGVHSLLAALPTGADAFGGDEARAKAFSELVEQSADNRKLRMMVKDAEKMFKESAGQPGQAEVGVVTAWMQLSTRNSAGAEATVKESLSADPGDLAPALTTLGLQARLDGLPKGTTPPADLIEGLKTQAETASAPEVKASATFHLARALEKADRMDEAVSTYQEVARSWPDSSEAPAALYELGQYFEGADQPTEALAAYEKVAREYSGAPQAQRARQFAGQLKVVGKTGKDVPVAEWLGGDPGTLEGDLKGKVVLYLFWASWCPHCRHEMPEIVKLYNTYKDQGLVVIGVTNLDKRQDKEKVASYMEEASVPFPVAIQEGRGGSQFYAVGGIPAAALVDRSGKVRWRNHPAQNVEAVIKKLLAEPAKPT